MPDDAGTGPATGTDGGAAGATDPNASTTAPTGNAADNATDPGTADGGEKDQAKELEKWKALARKHEQRSKENVAAATEWNKLQEGQKSELQKANERAEAAEQASANERAERFRLIAASKNGLSADLVEYLGGGDEAEITARAETLVKNIETEVVKRLDAELAKYGIQRDGQNGTAPTAAAAASLGLGRRPVESLRAGSAPAQTVPANKNDAFRSLLGR